LVVPLGDVLIFIETSTLRHKKFARYTLKIGGDIGVSLKFKIIKYLDLGTKIAKTLRQKVFKLYCGSTGKSILKSVR